MLRRRHRPIHYRPRSRSVFWLVSVVAAGLGVGAALHYWSEPSGIASSPTPPTRAATFSGRAEASGPVALRIGPVVLGLHAVDPPIVGIECPAGDCAALARAAMEQILGEREVHCVGRAQADARPAATCFLPDGTDVAAALVARGWALASGETPLYRAEEERARAAGLGLWARPSEAPAPALAAEPFAPLRAPDLPGPTPLGSGAYVPPEE